MNDEGRITAVCTPGQGGRRYVLNDGVRRFEEFTKPGQCGNVPWVRAHYPDGSTKELNVALLEYVERAAPEKLEKLEEVRWPEGAITPPPPPRPPRSKDPR